MTDNTNGDDVGTEASTNRPDEEAVAAIGVMLYDDLTIHAHTPGKGWRFTGAKFVDGKDADGAWEPEWRCECGTHGTGGDSRTMLLEAAIHTRREHGAW